MVFKSEARERCSQFRRHDTTQYLVLNGGEKENKINVTEFPRVLVILFLQLEQSAWFCVAFQLHSAAHCRCTIGSKGSLTGFCVLLGDYEGHKKGN